MFQYAFGRAFAARRHDELCLDTSMLNRAEGGSPGRPYGLGIFNVTGHLVSVSQLASSGIGLLCVLTETTLGGFRKEVMSDCLPSFKHVVLDGSWASELYFKDAAETIRKEFTFKSPNPGVPAMAERIATTTSVCLHVRRGDYINSVIGRHLGFVGEDYYKKALQFIPERVQDPHFFIFSDDLDWCKVNLKFTEPHTFVSLPELPAESRAYEELRLMTLCRHFIIANSTFSWWAAWLGSHAEKVVVAPVRWFVNGKVDCTQLIPTGWTQL